MIIKQTIIGATPDLFEDWRELPLGCTFTVENDSWVIASGHIDCEHRAKAGTVDKAIMIAFNALLHTKVDGVWVSKGWIDGAKTGCNIYNRTDHYGVCPIAFSVQVPPGEHKIVIMGRSASTAAPGVDGLAEVKDGFNCVTYNVVTA